MQISVSVRHGHLQAGDQAIIEEKVAKLRRLFDRIGAIEVTADLEHLEKPEVEVKVSAERAGQFVATSSAPTVLAALDLVIPKMEQQLRRAKEKKTGHQATGLGHLDSSPVDEQN
jgi:putative sigma-54 modulation protein